MSVYSKFYKNTIKHTHALAKALDPEFYDLFKKSISNIQDHPDLLYVKFLGAERTEKLPSDAVAVSQIKKEIERLTLLKENYSLQDNIGALKKKNHCEILINLLKDVIE